MISTFLLFLKLRLEITPVFENFLDVDAVQRGEAESWSHNFELYMRDLLGKLNRLNIAKYTGFSCKDDYPELMRSLVPAMRYLCAEAKDNINHGGAALPSVVQSIVTVAGVWAYQLEGTQRNRSYQSTLFGQGKEVMTSMRRQGFPTLSPGLMLHGVFAIGGVGVLFGNFMTLPSTVPYTMYKPGTTLLQSRSGANGTQPIMRQGHLQSAADVIWQNCPPNFYPEILARFDGAFKVEVVARSNVSHNIDVQAIYSTSRARTPINMRISKLDLGEGKCVAEDGSARNSTSIFAADNMAELLLTASQEEDNLIRLKGIMGVSVNGVDDYPFNLVEDALHRGVPGTAHDRSSHLYVLIPLIREIINVYHSMGYLKEVIQDQALQVVRAVVTIYVIESGTSAAIDYSNAAYRGGFIDVIGLREAVEVDRSKGGVLQQAKTIVQTFHNVWHDKSRQQFGFDTVTDPPDVLANVLS